MAYPLTEQDIAQMIAAGMNVMDAAPGAPATDAEKEFLGIQDDVDPGALPDPVAAAPQMAAPQVAAAMPPPAAPVTQQQVASADTGGGFNIMDKIFGANGDEQPNQFANLNRQQRMMLAFGAMRDAGMGLQGKESNSFNNTLKAINDQMDMGRKAKTAQTQQAALQGMLGAGGAGGDIQSQIARWTDMAVMYPSMAPGLALKIKALQDQMLEGKRDEGVGSAAASQLIDIDDIISRIDEDPTLTTGAWGWATRRLAITPAGRVQALLDSVQSTLALDSLKALKATGATMGSLNQSELQLLKDELVKIDLSSDQAFIKSQLGKVRGRYRRIMGDLYRGANADDTARLNSFLGVDQKPSWAGGASSSTSEPPSDEDLDRLYPPTTTN